MGMVVGCGGGPMQRQSEVQAQLYLDPSAALWSVWLGQTTRSVLADKHVTAFVQLEPDIAPF